MTEPVMTEADWLVDKHPLRMLAHLRDGLDIQRSGSGRRKLRLYGCACCRQVWHHLADERSRAAVFAAESFADRDLSAAELALARDRAERVLADLPDLYATRGSRALARAAVSVASDVAWHAAYDTVLFAALPEMERGDNPRDLPRQARLVREIFGNPFQQIRLEPAYLSWNDYIVVKLARTIYQKQRFDMMPILTDALEEAGCTDETL